jgi:uncharacterized membrane protein YgdD (TMEM256/DUF423 family)
MIPFAHVAGMPVEELLPSLAGPVGGLLMVRAWLAVSVRRDRNREQDR